LTLDHFQPRARGGNDDPDNLVYCCHACNEFKSDYWTNDEALRLLHPQRDNLSSHIELADDFTLRARTARGQNHIDRLHLNRPGLIENRRRRADLADAQRERDRNAQERLAALTEREELLRELDEARTEMRRLTEELSRRQP
jgi:hypothetical protein